MGVPGIRMRARTGRSGDSTFLVSAAESVCSRFALGQLACALGGLHLAVHHGKTDLDPTSDFAEGLAFGAAAKDRASLVLVNYTGTAAGAAAAGGGVQAVAGLRTMSRRRSSASARARSRIRVRSVCFPAAMPLRI
jgi:hypothetical protein